MDDAEFAPEQSDEVSCRVPTREDLVGLCRKLNEAGARYVVVGGMAIIHAGYIRATMDVDLLIDVDPVNESKVLGVLATLPDGAAKELKVGEVAEYVVVRVNDEFTVDLMRASSGIDFAGAQGEIVMRELDGVSIPFASPRLLWLMKRKTYREKDQGDLVFLRQQYPEVTVD